MKRFGMFRVFKIVVLATLAAAVFSLVVMGLWNVLVPAIFGLRAITFWQAAGLLLLSKILFGGLRGPGGGGPRWRRRLLDRWEKMTPEEREKFKQGMRGACGPRAGAEARA